MLKAHHIGIVAPESYLELCAAVRKRPAMYFGNEPVPRIFHDLLDAILGHAPRHYPGPISVRVTKQGVITIHFAGLVSPFFKPAQLDSWLNRLCPGKYFTWPILPVAALSEIFRVESSTARQKAILTMRHGQRVNTDTRSASGASFLKVTYKADATIVGRLSQEELYNFSGRLRDLSLLRAGLATQFHADVLPGEIRYCYKSGLESYLFEEDYFRFSQHPGVISFKRRGNGMAVECALRFLHAGVPHVRSYVNYQPTQGGAHLEGLGLALNDLFPDSKWGCREVTFVTNPDTGAKVVLPRCFIGIIHVQAPARFSGPTKDILIGDEIRAFVHESANDPLREQWERLEKRWPPRRSR